jgi:hypothetical protein
VLKDPAPVPETGALGDRLNMVFNGTAILSVVLALGVQRMARRNAIVKRLSSVETLGSASLVCPTRPGR